MLTSSDKSSDGSLVVNLTTNDPSGSFKPLIYMHPYSSRSLIYVVRGLIDSHGYKDYGVDISLSTIDMFDEFDDRIHGDILDSVNARLLRLTKKARGAFAFFYHEHKVLAIFDSGDIDVDYHLTTSNAYYNKVFIRRDMEINKLTTHAERVYIISPGAYHELS